MITRLGALGGVILFMIAAALIPAAARIGAANLSLSATSGPPGGMVAVNGSGFAANSGIVVRWENVAGATLGSGAADSSGAFSGLAVAIPAGASLGAHALYVTDGATSLTAPLSVVAPLSLTLTPTASAAGGLVTATGAGFAPGETVALHWESAAGAVLAAPAAGPDGGFAVNLTVPTGATLDLHNVVAVGTSSGRVVAATLSVIHSAATLTASPATAAAGATVTVSGAGFTPGSTVALRWETFNGVTLASAASDAQGGFSGVAVIVPAGASAADHTLHASDGALTASAVIHVTSAAPAATPSPTPASTATPTPTATPTSTPSPTPTATPRPDDDDDDEDEDGGHGWGRRGDERPGWGCGDRNHQHLGAAGAGKESPCKRTQDDDGDGQTAILKNTDHEKESARDRDHRGKEKTDRDDKSHGKEKDGMRHGKDENGIRHGKDEDGRGRGRGKD